MKKILIGLACIIALFIVAAIILHGTSAPPPLPAASETTLGSSNPTVPPALNPSKALPPVAGTTYANPQPVTIEGYSGPQEDPVISPDNQYLFFDSHNDAGLPVYLYWAKRIDYKTFQFMGEIQGVNEPGYHQVEGCEDAAHDFYFIRDIPSDQSGSTIFRGTFANGVVANIEPVRGIPPPPPSPGNISAQGDLYITPDGNTLYSTDSQLNQSGFKSAQIFIATKNPDGSFTRLPNSSQILKNVNAMSTVGPIVYNPTPSVDGLTFAFNDGGPQLLPKIYIATRSSTAEPFGTPQLVAAADQVTGVLSEPGSFSPDGTHLYFHRALSQTTSQIYVLTRR